MARPGYPKSIVEFQRWFPDEAACREYLVASRWPEGFRCPRCGRDRGWPLVARLVWECAACHAQSSVGGTHRGVRVTHLQTHLDEYVFRFNRRNTPMAAFQTVLGLGSQHRPTTYKEITGHKAEPELSG